MVATNTISDLRSRIRSIPDFPKPGIVFRDITTLLKDPQAFCQTIDMFYAQFRDRGIQKVVSIESRGFIFGAPLAYRLGAGFVPVRKPNKLPAEKLREEYALEYGTDALEVHKDAISEGTRALIVDDLLATGGTAAAVTQLVEKLGGKVAGLVFVVELDFLHGRDKLAGYEVRSLLHYDK